MNTRIARTAAALITIPALSAAAAPEPATVRVEAFTIPSVDLTLAFTISGVVTDTPVRPGDPVEAGAVLARLDDRETAAQLALYRIRAESTLDRQLAQAELELAQTELARVRQAFEQGGMGDLEVKRRELETLVAEIRLRSAEQESAEARITLQQAEAAAERLILRAPAAGIVDRLIVDVGESVERLSPVARIVSIDPVRVEAAVPLADAQGIEPGAPATLSGIDIPGVLHGRVLRIAPVADAASGTVVVTVEAANPDLVPAGARVWAEFTNVKSAQTPTDHRSIP